MSILKSGQSILTPKQDRGMSWFPREAYAGLRTYLRPWLDFLYHYDAQVKKESPDEAWFLSGDVTFLSYLNQVGHGSIVDFYSEKTSFVYREHGFNLMFRCPPISQLLSHLNTVLFTINDSSGLPDLPVLGDACFDPVSSHVLGVPSPFLTKNEPKSGGDRIDGYQALHKTNV